MQIALVLLFFLSTGLVLYRSLQTKDAINTFLSKEQTDLVKGIAIVMIALAHIYQASPAEVLSGGVSRVVLSWGSVGVSLFFFLSGYGNYFSIQKTKDNKTRLIWCLKKVWRLILTFVLCFVAVIVVICVFPDGNWNVSIFWNDFISLRIPGTSTWYLKIQILMYIFLAIAAYMEKQKSLIVAILACMYAVIAYWGGLADYWWKNAMPFAVGIWFAENRDTICPYLSKHCGRMRIVGISTFLVSYACLVLARGYHLIPQLLIFTVLPTSLILLVVMFGMKSNAYAKIGKWSLEIYLIHIGLLWEIFSGQTWYAGRCILYLCLTVILSASIHKLIQMMSVK